MNYQHWRGITDSRYGYGAMYEGFINHVPPSVTLDESASVVVYMGIPQLFQRALKGQHRVLFTMWETTELPPVFRFGLNLFDQVIVPNEHDREVFGKWHPITTVVPLGVNTTEYHPLDVPRVDRFQFRAGGSLWLRKGLDVVVEAFNRLALPDADLRIKIAPHARNVPTGSLGPNIYFDRQWMTQDEKCRWFAEADCFIAAARGEGFGLMPLQTIAMGIPTIVSLTTGQIQFSHLATGKLNCEKRPSSSYGYWDEPNLDELCELMKDHYDNSTKYRKQAMKNVPKVDQFSWGRAVDQLVSAVPKGHKLPTATVQDLPVMLPVRATKPIDATIGNARIRMAKGQEMEITDGQYQVLYDAGVVEVA